MNKVKVLVVDDSIFFRKIIMDGLAKNPNIEVVGHAIDAFDAMDKIPKLNPNVVTLDVEMPKMNGIELLKRLMPKHPVPVVLVSAVNISVFEALSVGAVDFVRKPDMQMGNSMDNFIRDLSNKVVVASAARVRSTATGAVKVPTIPNANVLKHDNKTDSIIIAIGASTGGTEATLTVLKDLPAHTPGIVVVQHMPPGFTKMYADRLDKICAMEVREAKNGDKIKRGLVLIAPGDAHMRVMKTGLEYSVQCQSGEKVSGHCPSVDVLFESMAKNVGKNGVGIIMTGMGRDGAANMLKMRQAGAYTIGQDQASCVVYGMPMEAYNLGAVIKQASCEQISGVLKNYLNSL